MEKPDPIQGRNTAYVCRVFRTQACSSRSENIILTIYHMDITSPDRLIKRIEPVATKLHALTVPMDFFAGNYQALTKMGMPIYVHGPPANINSRELHARFKRLG